MGAPNEKDGITATVSSVPQEEEASKEGLLHTEETGGQEKPNRNVAAAIWAIVCGVGIPCIPVVVISAVLLYFIFHHEIKTKPGYPELALHPTHVHQHMNGTERLFDIRHHGGKWAYYVHYNPSTITTIASWTGRVIPYLSSSIMALVAFFAARRIVVKSKRGDGSDLPTTEQLTILIGLLGGNGFGPLKDTVVHRFARKQKLADPIPLAAAALAIITFAAILVPIVDSWFGIATTPAIVTQLYNHTGPVHTFGRSLSTAQCSQTGLPNDTAVAGGFSGFGGLEWLSCNLHYDDDNPYGIAPYLVGPDEAARLAQGPTKSNIIRNFTDSTGIEYQYLADPNMDGKLDFKANTVALSSTCRPITAQCLPGQHWPSITGEQNDGPQYYYNYNFSCSPGFKANFTFNGAAQMLDASALDGGIDGPSPNSGGFPTPSIGMAFAPDRNLSRRVGQFYPNLSGIVPTLPGFNAEGGGFDPNAAVVGSNWSYQYILPSNPLNFAVWASGFPTFDGKLVENNIVDNPLLKDTNVFQDIDFTYWILGCETTVWDVTYTWVNGSIHTFNATSASKDMGGLISAPFAFQLGQVMPALTNLASVAGTRNNSVDLANSFADGFSQAALAMSVGVLDPIPNMIEQVRNSTIAVARVPMIPLYLLIGFKAIYVVAVIALAIGAYCFTHPGETEVVKAQLSAKGLAAAHFDDPHLLQKNVVKELQARIQPGNGGGAQQKGGKPALQRAQTAPSGPAGEREEGAAVPDKRVGLVAQADGAWKFALIADGVWQSVKPIAVNMLTMEAADGQLGTAGQVINAWK